MREYIMETSDTGWVTKVKQEIVRCKDCRNAVVYDGYMVVCTHIDSNGNDQHTAEWFCADGEKK